MQLHWRYDGIAQIEPAPPQYFSPGDDIEQNADVTRNSLLRKVQAEGAVAYRLGGEVEELGLAGSRYSMLNWVAAVDRLIKVVLGQPRFTEQWRGCDAALPEFHHRLPYGEARRRQEDLLIPILNHFNAMPQRLWRDLATHWRMKSSERSRI